jgi:asparagine synthase (glutamine-hydrolysing)
MCSIGSVNISIGKGYGWGLFEIPDGKIYFKGYLNGHIDTAEAAAHLSYALINAGRGELNALESLDGHFAAIVETPQCIIAAVDRVRSIPLLWAALPTGGCLIGDHSAPFLERLSLGKNLIDADAAQDLALAGYVLGRDTLYRPVKALLPGEVAVFAGAKPQIRRYALYRPWLAQTEAQDERRLREELRDVTLHVLQKMIDRAQGRQFLLPLSAGLDSRLIASGLKHLGYRNVQCFSYGRPGNHEADAARKIATKLGYPWHFLPTSTREVRLRRRGAEFERYMTLADNLAATPVEQDVFTIMDLHLQPWAQRDGIIVNGQSGDYISGNHIPASLNGHVPAQRQARDAAIVAAMVNKHFDLWPDLRTPHNLSRIQARLWKEFEEVGAPLDDPALAFALYEFSEFQNRQAKYVLGNQRSYEVFGWDWHLPLWDRDYLEFWQKVPLTMKFGQHLYREMLVEANWGDVWTSLLPAPRWITPAAVRPLRHAAHLLCLPFGETAWKAVDRRFFNHITDSLRKYSAVGYWQVATGPAHRNVVAWLTALYLERHGLSRDGKV